MATVCVVDHTTAGGDILQANKRCAHYMGWDKEALCGRPLEVLAALACLTATATGSLCSSVLQLPLEATLQHWRWCPCSILFTHLARTGACGEGSRA